MIIIKRIKQETEGNVFTFQFTNQFGNVIEYPSIAFIPREFANIVKVSVKNSFNNETRVELDVPAKRINDLMYLEFKELTFDLETRYTVVVSDGDEVIYTDQIMVTEQEPRNYNLLWFNETKIN